MGDEVARELEARIAELRRRIPHHSIPPSLIAQIEELEERLEQVRREEGTSGRE